MTRALDEREELRRHALTAFLDERVREGYLVETRTATHAIIGPPDRRSPRRLFRRPTSLVVSQGVVALRTNVSLIVREVMVDGDAATGDSSAAARVSVPAPSYRAGG